MFIKYFLLASFFLFSSASSDCLSCICQKESGCKAIGCNMDQGSLSCGYFQIKLPYYIDCGQPDKHAGESTETAWKRCSDDFGCATKCVKIYYNRYKSQCKGLGMGGCQVLARNHNGGPRGCRNSGTKGYWEGVRKCCGGCQ